MQDLESLFRWAIYYDYRTTPEQLISKMKNRMLDGVDAVMNVPNAVHDWGMVTAYGNVTECSPAQLSRSHFVLSLSEFLSQFKQNILDESKSRKIDGRAVAAVISWEFQENILGRWTDYMQILKPGKSSGVGWGSMHAQEALRRVEGKHTLKEIACIRMDAVTLIPLVAQFLKDCVDTYYKASGGVYIGKEPAIMAFFYNTGLGKANESAKKWKKKLDKMNQTPSQIELKVSVNPMAKWVMDNIDDFSNFKTEPSISGRIRTVAVPI